MRGLLLLALGASLGAWCSAKELRKPPSPPADDTAAETTSALLDREIAALAPQRPGHRDLYVLAVAGDGTEAVFRNEVLHLENLATRRLDAAGRVLVLANHPADSLQRPLAPADPGNLRRALAGLGDAMDPDEDLLLLYLTSHGTEDHRFLLRRPDRADRLLTPRQLREALDASGIRHRVVAISACYSGGFARALDDPDTLLLMAARRDRASFGCGNDSVATYFGRAWLVDGLNDTLDFSLAFDQAVKRIEQRERAEGLLPSRPQRQQGQRIGATLAAWRAGFTPGPALPYPHAEAEDEGEKLIPPRRPADKSGSR